MSAEQGVLFEMPMPREAVIEQLNVLTEQKWNLLDEMAAVELGRVALIKILRGE